MLIFNCSFFPLDIVQITNDLLVSVYSHHAKELIVKTIDLVKTHFTLKSTSITNIPMKVQ